MGKFAPLSAIHRRRIVDPNGAHVGHIHDVLLDLRDGRIEYVCIALEDTTRSDAPEVVVPWSALRARGEGTSDWEIAAGKRLLQDIAQPASSRG